MEGESEDQLTRRERLRAERELEHAAPARIGLKLAGVVVIVIALLSWLAVSWLSGAAPAGAPVPEPPPLEGTAQGGTALEGTAQGGAAQGGTALQGSPQPEDGAGEGASQADPPGAGAEAPGGGAEAPGAEEPSQVVVHVGGAVAKPGVVELVAGARVHEAIEAAGGMTSKADPGGLNLAAPVQDGTVIWVSTPEELETGTGPPVAGPGSADQDAAGPPGAGVGNAPGPVTGGDDSGPGTGAGDLINLNTADAATLDELPGIGPALSERIISYREANGPFGSLEELAGVSGIGPVILENVAGLVTW